MTVNEECPKCGMLPVAAVIRWKGSPREDQVCWRCAGNLEILNDDCWVSPTPTPAPEVAR